MKIAEYSSGHILKSNLPLPVNENSGQVSLPENTYIDLHPDKNSLNDSLNMMFGQYVQQNRPIIDKNTKEFFQKNPIFERAINLYQTLDNTLEGKRNGSLRQLRNFSDAVSAGLSHYDNQSTEELLITEDLLEILDQPLANSAHAEEFMNERPDSYFQLEAILNYFKNHSGTLLDVYG
jgi:hypothetical protein